MALIPTLSLPWPWVWEEELKNKSLKTYASLARIGFPKSYSAKIMLVVFAGTHLPLVAMVLYLLLVSPGGLGTHLGVLAALLIATLLGFVATLFVLRAACPGASGVLLARSLPTRT
jgi:hypothetical protein